MRSNGIIGTEKNESRMINEKTNINEMIIERKTIVFSAFFAFRYLFIFS